MMIKVFILSCMLCVHGPFNFEFLSGNWEFINSKTKPATRHSLHNNADGSNHHGGMARAAVSHVDDNFWKDTSFGVQRPKHGHRAVYGKGNSEPITMMITWKQSDVFEAQATVSDSPWRNCGRFV